MSWRIQIQDPSGELRRYPISGQMTFGRSKDAMIVLRDATVAPLAFTLWKDGAESQEARSPKRSRVSPFWMKVSDAQAPALLGDLRVKEANIPPDFTIRLGETRISILRDQAESALPEQPRGVTHWKTSSESGARLLWTVKKAADTPLSIYLAGETGVGKEVLAHLIHGWSDRAKGPFVPLHCGALPLSLAESELFGHTKGSFTGAHQHRSGALMQAHGGTLFLDEIGDLPMDIQVKLLRFLENGEIRPVGSDRTLRANVRLLCATHHPLQKLVEEGKFRRDLFYRLASVTIQIPALREPPDDIELLANDFAAQLERTISAQAMLRLQAHAWPGNVRELRHAIERAAGLAGPLSPVLGEEAFEFLLTPENLAVSPTIEFGSAALKLEEMERLMLLKALRLARGNRSRAAKILGVARSTLFEMIKRHRIAGPLRSTLDFVA